MIESKASLPYIHHDRKYFRMNQDVMERKMFYGTIPDTFIAARYLRQNLTRCEEMLWQRLRNKAIQGYRFKCQHPIGYYVADFYCHAAKLVIEVDGNYHISSEQHFYDTQRTNDMQALGIAVLRFSNYQVENDIEFVVNQIRSFIIEHRKEGY
jgi:very-short-patch-repair endonuclease